VIAEESAVAGYVCPVVEVGLLSLPWSWLVAGYTWVWPHVSRAECGACGVCLVPVAILVDAPVGYFRSFLTLLVGLQPFHRPAELWN
jgi:hypothetical protein